MVLSSTKANTKYAIKNNHKQKTRKQLFKRLNKRSTYKHKNNKRTYKQRTLRGGAGALGAGGVKLPVGDVRKDNAIIVIGGYGGTISRTILNDLNVLNVPGDAKTFDIFYFARTEFPGNDQQNTQMTDEQLKNPNKPIFCNCDLNSPGGLDIFVENLSTILNAYTKTFIINCAADKDSSTVMKTYIKTDKYKINFEDYTKKFSNQTDLVKDFLIQRNNNDKPIYTLNLSLSLAAQNTEDWHWTMHVAYNLAELRVTYADKLHLIHLSTVYVNKGNFLEGKTKWSNDYVNYKRYNPEIVTHHEKKSDIDKHKQTQTTLYNIDPTKVEFNNYIYGLIKGLTEQIIKGNSGKNNNFVIIRLPVIMNEKLTNLAETSPSKVVNDVFKRLNEFITGIITYTEDDKKLLAHEPVVDPLKFDNKHQRFPLTAQYVSKYIIDKINTSITADSPVVWNGIHSLCNTQSITKYKIAKAFYIKLYKTNEKDACKTLKDRECPHVDNFILVDQDAEYDNYLPYSEKMDRDTYLDETMPLTNNNIMESIIKGFRYNVQKTIDLATAPPPPSITTITPA